MQHWHEEKVLGIAPKPPLSGGRTKVYVSFKSTTSEDVLMLSATVMRRLEALGDLSPQGKRLTGWFRLLEDRVLWHEAYAKSYAKKGAITPGGDEVTPAGFSEESTCRCAAPPGMKMGPERVAARERRAKPELPRTAPCPAHLTPWRVPPQSTPHCL
jgi:hypothetical protein